MTSVTVGEAREHLAEILDKAAFKSIRTVVTRRGKAVAAVVPIEDLQAIEDLEEQIDNSLADKRLADLKSGKEKLIPWEKIKAEQRL